MIKSSIPCPIFFVLGAISFKINAIFLPLAIVIRAA
jgi:hypothetical protein